MIQFKSVSKSFRRNRVLDNVNLSIQTGDRVAFVGSNGAGKTTLIRCLLGEYACEGHVTVNGQEARQHRQDILQHIGFVPQLPPPLKMPVGQLLRFAAGVCNSDPSHMAAVAARLGLETRTVSHQPFFKLSGGQKQKLLIGLALGRDAKLLVMDEPAANLDPEARHQFFQLLAEKQQQAAMIISSHRLDEVAALVNRVVELDRGKVVLDDHVADQVDMDSILACRVTLYQPSSAFAETIREWGFAESSGGRVWSGQVAGPDRLRFLGVASRYAGLLKGMQMEEKV